MDGPITLRDQNYTALLQKVRELCASFCSSSFNHSTHLCAFERQLQREIAKIRAEFELGGIQPEQFDQFMHRKNIRAVCRRGGLSTLRFCAFGSVQRKLDAWVECANKQVGAYPMFLRPVMTINGNCMHTLCVARNAEDLRSWIRVLFKSIN